MNIKNKKYTKKQIEWCDNYLDATTFDPLMDQFEAGEETFQQAAQRSVHWFEQWSQNALLNCDKNQISLNTKY